MEIEPVTIGERSYVTPRPGSAVLNSEAGALELVAACMQAGTNRVLLPGECLPDEFFQLRSGLAGVVMLRFSLYQIIAAAVLSPAQVGNGRFYEMVLETNRGDQFRVFTEKAAAEQWLLQDR